jgi:hypothetical protein
MTDAVLTWRNVTRGSISSSDSSSTRSGDEDIDRQFHNVRDVDSRSNADFWGIRTNAETVEGFWPKPSGP